MKRQNHSRKAVLSSTILGFGAVAIIVVSLTSVLNARLAFTQSVPPRNPLTVDAVIYALQDRYANEGSGVDPGTAVIRLMEMASQKAYIGVAA